MKDKKLKSIFKDRFYLELCRVRNAQWSQLEPMIIQASKDLDVPLVAANDVHYLHREDQIAQEVLICIGSNRTLNERIRRGPLKW